MSVSEAEKNMKLSQSNYIKSKKRGKKIWK